MTAFERAATKDIQTSIDVAIATTPGAFNQVRQAKTDGREGLCVLWPCLKNKIEVLKDVEEESKSLKDKKSCSGQKKERTRRKSKKKLEACGLVKAEITKSVNTNYGTHRENDGIVQYEQQEGLTVMRDNKACWKLKDLTPTISLIGRVDGLISDDCVLEVKNRNEEEKISSTRSRLSRTCKCNRTCSSSTVRAQSCYNVFREAGKNTLKAIQVEKDDDFWNGRVMTRMKSMCKTSGSCM